MRVQQCVLLFHPFDVFKLLVEQCQVTRSVLHSFNLASHQVNGPMGYFAKFIHHSANQQGLHRTRHSTRIERNFQFLGLLSISIILCILCITHSVNNYSVTNSTNSVASTVSATRNHNLISSSVLSCANFANLSATIAGGIAGGNAAGGRLLGGLLEVSHNDRWRKNNVGEILSEQV